MIPIRYIKEFLIQQVTTGYQIITEKYYRS